MSVTKKIHMNIATVGHIEHGKTTLSAAVSKFCAEKWGGIFKAYKDIDNSKEERERGITIAVSTLELQTSKRDYAWSDCPGHESFMKNTLSGTSGIDAAILILSSKDSLQEQTIAHLKSIHARGTKKIVVVLTKMDLSDPDSRELTEMELENIMDSLGYHKVEIPKEIYDNRNDFDKDYSSLFTHDNDYEYVVVRLSAHLALQDDQSEYGVPAIALLMKVLDDFLPNPARNYDAPFFMPVEHAYSIKGRGVVLAGKVILGVAKKDDQLNLVGVGCNYNGTVTSMEIFKKSSAQAEAGDNVGILMRFSESLGISDAKTGAILAAPNSYYETKKIKCFVEEFTVSAGKKSKKEKKPYTTGYEPQFSIYTALITGKVTFADENWQPKEDMQVREGDKNINIIVDLHAPIALPKNVSYIPFIMREGSSNKAYGYIQQDQEQAGAAS